MTIISPLASWSTTSTGTSEKLANGWEQVDAVAFMGRWLLSAGPSPAGREKARGQSRKGPAKEFS